MNWQEFKAQHATTYLSASGLEDEQVICFQALRPDQLDTAIKRNQWGKKYAKVWSIIKTEVGNQKIEILLTISQILCLIDLDAFTPYQDGAKWGKKLLAVRIAGDRNNTLVRFKVA